MPWMILESKKQNVKQVSQACNLLIEDVRAPENALHAH